MTSYNKENITTDEKDKKKGIFKNLSPKGRRIIGVFTSFNLGVASVFCIVFPIFILIRYSYFGYYAIQLLITVSLMIIPFILFGLLILRPIKRKKEISKGSLAGVSIAIIFSFLPFLFFITLLFLGIPEAITFYLVLFLLFLGITAGISLILTPFFKIKDRKKDENDLNKNVKEVKSE